MTTPSDVERDHQIALAFALLLAQSPASAEASLFTRAVSMVDAPSDTDTTTLESLTRHSEHADLTQSPAAFQTTLPILAQGPVRHAATGDRVDWSKVDVDALTGRDRVADGYPSAAESASPAKAADDEDAGMKKLMEFLPIIVAQFGFAFVSSLANKLPYGRVLVPLTGAVLYWQAKPRAVVKGKTGWAATATGLSQVVTGLVETSVSTVLLTNTASIIGFPLALLASVGVFYELNKIVKQEETAAKSSLAWQDYTWQAKLGLAYKASMPMIVGREFHTYVAPGNGWYATPAKWAPWNEPVALSMSILQTAPSYAWNVGVGLLNMIVLRAACIKGAQMLYNHGPEYASKASGLLTQAKGPWSMYSDSGMPQMSQAQQAEAQKRMQSLTPEQQQQFVKRMQQQGGNPNLQMRPGAAAA